MARLKVQVGLPYRTAAGEEVRIYATDGGGEHPVHAARKALPDPDIGNTLDPIWHMMRTDIYGEKGNARLYHPYLMPFSYIVQQGEEFDKEGFLRFNDEVVIPPQVFRFFGKALAEWPRGVTYLDDWLDWKL